MPLQLLGAGVGALCLLAVWRVKAGLIRFKVGPNVRSFVYFLLMVGTAIATLLVYRGGMGFKCRPVELGAEACNLGSAARSIRLATLQVYTDRRKDQSAGLA